MYIPGYFAVTNREEIFSFIEANSFGQLTSLVQGRIFSTHMPFLISADKQRVTGHFAKQNPQHSKLGQQEAMISLQGAHDYISPSWYASKGVPTWNYQAVHIYGTCSVFDDTERLKNLVDELTAKNEAAFERPWQADYEASMLNAIIGFEMKITEIQCSYKMNQNRSLQDRTQVIESLKSRGSTKLARAMTELENGS